MYDVHSHIYQDAIEFYENVFVVIIFAQIVVELGCRKENPMKYERFFVKYVIVRSLSFQKKRGIKGKKD